ncbi:hypothetical protein [Methylobacterium isbiliense]|jgi:VanZ family protein|uniref:VanZ-like domain-containing protein n=1 Tax=Methylobacterium isbiliense TaxID=315478 RepID=A0ABQ4SNA5_9HYPH|nr:hypothetical protein [Methylobacterium isbiliense]MDN3627023.1 hypothetical protein [Methylobacterium isbiliense]GJE03171.1 hypothetical protein GMJLKIPL_5122 [Methylobacterium isbiliense]
MSRSVLMLRKAALAAGGLCLLALVWLSWIPKDWEVRTSLAGQIEHVLAYAGTAAILAVGLPRPSASRLFAALVTLAGLLEIGQRWVPGRTAQVVDFAASSLGAGLGTLAGLLALRALLRHDRTS